GRHVHQTIVIRLGLRRARFPLLGGLCLFGGCRLGFWLLNPRPGLGGRVYSVALTINFYDRHAGSLRVKRDINFFLRRFHDNQLAEHAVMAGAADHRAPKLESPHSIGCKSYVDRLLRRDFLVDAKLLELNSVIDVGGSDDQLYRFALLHGNRWRIKLESFGGDFDLDGLLGISLALS